MHIVDKRHLNVQKGLDFIDNAKDGVFILGTNKYGVFVKEWLTKINIPVLGFINDYSKSLHFDGLSVVASSTIPRNHNLINCIVEGRAIEAYDNLLSLEPKQVINYFELQIAYPKFLQEIDFLSNTDTILQFEDQYKRLHEMLGDEESKQTLSNIVDFRLNRNIESLRRFRFSIKEQYFEPFLTLSERAVFIDGGGFDGSTSLYFANKYPNYNSIYFFEPNTEIMPLAKLNMKHLENVFFYEMGLWSSKTTLQFDSTLSSASKLSSEGNIIIPTITLDEVITDKVDFIKLDVEGAEFEAIRGANNVILKQKPKLAICVYHGQEDFIRIPELISNFRNDYKVYLRHYTQGVFETVMYFI